MTFLFIVLALVVVGFIAYRLRVPIAAKILGQPESRIRRQLGSKD
jgi:hypothetical protein